MRQLIQLAAALIIFSMFFLFVRAPRFEEKKDETRDNQENPHGLSEEEFLMLRNPVTNTIPDHMRQKELNFFRGVQATLQISHLQKESAQPLVWEERGPSNVGGRTRALAADIAHPGVLIAGGVNGGIWKTTNDGLTWTQKFRPDQIHSTSCIAQDTRLGKTSTWYVGTGEFLGSTAYIYRLGAIYNGDGIFKSTNNGESWFLLPNTISGTPQISDNFDFVWNVAVNPLNTTEDEIYAATWNGIYRSADGGGTWSQVRSSDPGTVGERSVTTEIAVSSQGIKFAHTRVSGAQKIWRSVDGVVWTDITPASFPASSARIVFGTAPSNSNILYVFISTVADGHQLWKYTENNSNYSWENRSANLPGDLSTLSGYAQLVQVKSDDENFLVLGGTNLYRSTDGFASTAKTTTIGGYPFWPGSHHPDMHSGMFKPTDSKVYYSGNDGGIHKTDDITQASMKWSTLDSGYAVTQFYSVSISPDSNDHAIVGGTQDNGSQLTMVPGMSSWNMLTGGDGTICRLAPVASDIVFTQTQNGSLFRLTRNGYNTTQLTPNGSTRQLFVNPIALDPNNPSIIYYAAGKITSPSMWSGIWWNSKASTATSNSGWTAILASDVGAPGTWTRQVSTIGISKNNSANVLYYGTTDGIIKRIDQANTANPTVSNITPPDLAGGTAQGGYVKWIAVDPSNSNIALALFGNYMFKSLWYTTNGGATWTDVEGNLAGDNGPSIRHAVLIPGKGDYRAFLATSVGLFMTSEMNGSATIWTPAAANDIGNVLSVYLDFRESDRTLAVATHGRGVFTTRLPETPVSVTQTKTLPKQFTLEQNFPNPFNPSTTIRYSLPASSHVELSIFSLDGKKVSVLVNEVQSAGWKEVQCNASGFASGMYLVRMQANNPSTSSGQVFTKTKKILLMK